MALVFRLKGAERYSLASVVDAIEQLVIQELEPQLIIDRLASENRNERRAWFQLAYRANKISLGEVIRRGLEDNDIMIRVWSTQKIRELSDDNQMQQLLDEASISRFPDLRAAALEIYCQQFPDLVYSKAITGLLDRSPDVRGVARRWLKKHENFDCVSFYHGILEHPKDTEVHAAINGLGECGSKQDINYVLPYLEHPSAKIRMSIARLLG
jgi:hypothetical protein